MINKCIEYTNLRPTATCHDIDVLCEEAIGYHYLGVCVAPSYLSQSKKRLAGQDCRLITVVGFPLGYQTRHVKVNECLDYIERGADEIDCVVNIGAVLNADWSYIESEIDMLTQTVKAKNKLIKIIFETCYLNEAQIVKLCQICTTCGVHFVKTSTGYGSRGASLPDISLMRKSLPTNISIKASGGIKTVDQARLLILAGASRIGTSSLLLD